MADRPASPDDIAVIGMACMFPQAPNLDAFWRNILGRVDAISDPPADAWEVDIAYDQASQENDRVYCKRGGYLGPVAFFNPLAYGVMPRSAEGGDPDQWLALHVAKEAMVDAGYPDGPPDRRDVAVIIGKGNYVTRGNSSMVQHSHAVDQVLKVLRQLQPDLSEAHLHLIRNDLKRQLPRFDAETAGALVPNILAGRIANRLDLMGPSYTVDAACASSLVAIELAIKGIRNGEYTAALAGGVNVTTPFTLMSLFCQLGALSRSQCIRPFDKDADGTLMSEGLGMVVLKRLTDAERDGNRIYAVIKGVGVASDGRALGVLAPRVEGEELALRRAYESSGIDPATISLIEAHGTGTLVGDAVEIEALRRVFPAPDTRLPSCAIGTVKSMIGHTLPAAGIAGLIKTALSLYHRVLPATLHVTQPSPKLEIERSPFYVNTETRPWIHRTDQPRRAGVNAFGFGGINAHLIVEEHPSADRSAPATPLPWDTEVCIVRGGGRADLLRQIEHLQRRVDAEPEKPLFELASELNLRVNGHDFATACSLSIVASTTADLRQKLARAGTRLADPACRRIKDPGGIYFADEPLGRQGKLAFLFPGEGAQFVNMLADLCLHFPQVRSCFDEMDRMMASDARCGSTGQHVFPSPAFSAADREAAEWRLFQMEAAIEAVITANHALHTLLTDLGIRPDAMVGHSTGEYSAMRAAGMLDEARYGEHLKRLNEVYKSFATTVPTDVTLLAAGAPRAQVAQILAELDGGLHVAMDNCPHQVVFIGDKQTAAKAAEALKSHGVLYETLRFDRAYHTPLFAEFADRLRAFQDEWIVATPRLPLYSCTSVGPFPEDLTEVRRIAVDHWTHCVEFSRTIERMYADGVRVFVEVGPRGNLTTFVDDILGSRPHLAVPASVMRRSGITQLNHLIGMLTAHGVSMRLDAMYRRRLLQQSRDAAGESMTLRAGEVKLQTGWPAIDLSPEVVAQLRKAQPTAPAVQAPQPAPEMPAAAPPTSVAAAAPASAGTAPVMSAYLQTMEQFLAVQQRVMMQALTGASTTMPAARTAADPIPTSVAAPAAPRQPALELVSIPTITVTPSDTRTPAPAAPAQATARAQAVAPVPVAAPAAAVAPATTALDASGIRTILMRIVAEKTGYPAEMLDSKADLEADLGIDSIKRVEILGAFQRQTGIALGDRMDRLTARKTLDQTIELLTEFIQGSSRGAGDTAPPAQDPTSFPFINKVVTFVPGEQLIALCDVNLQRYPFLRDHTFGREVSAIDPDLLGWTIMPLTMSMEILAEAASALMGELKFVGMKDIRTRRWIALEEAPVQLRIAARRTSPTEAAVEIYEADERSGAPSATPIMTGSMLFADRYPDPPPAETLVLQEEAPFRWVPEELYGELMFHGPSMQGVRSMNRVGLNGSEATLEVLPWDGMFASADPSKFATDGNLLDQVGQVVGFWAAQVPTSPCLVPPIGLESLQLYGPPLPAHTRVTCQARTALIAEKQVRSNLDVIDGSGRLWAKLVGWQNRRFDLPPEFYKYLLTTRDLFLSKPWDSPFQGVLRGHRGYQLGVHHFLEGWFSSHGSFWRRVFAYLILGRRERALWHAMGESESRKIEWLLGRIAAKDGVRHLVRERFNLALCPADVEILPDELGRPVVHGAWTKTVPFVPTVSISHADGLAVALVGSGEEGFGVGVDLERVGRMNIDVHALAFTPEEEGLLSSLRSQGGTEWPLRFWCAKEAAAKALGEGMRKGPRSLIVRRADLKSGALEVSVPGNGVVLETYTAREGDLIVAAAAASAQRSIKP